jgi:hypothetical protein
MLANIIWGMVVMPGGKRRPTTVLKMVVLDFDNDNCPKMELSEVLRAKRQLPTFVFIS